MKNSKHRIFTIKTILFLLESCIDIRILLAIAKQPELRYIIHVQYVDLSYVQFVMYHHVLIDSKLHDSECYVCYIIYMFVLKLRICESI